MPAPGSWTHWFPSQISGVVTTSSVCVPPRHGQHSPIVQHGKCRVPAAVGHVGYPVRGFRPGEKKYVVSMPAIVPVVTAVHHQAAVRHERMAGTKQHVIADAYDRQAVGGSRSRDPKSAACPSYQVTSGLTPREDLSIGQQIHVQRHDVPRNDRTPFDPLRGFRGQSEIVDR